MAQPSTSNFYRILLLCVLPLVVQNAVRGQSPSAPPRDRQPDTAPPAGISPAARAAVEEGLKLLEQKRFKEATKVFLAAVRRHQENGQFRHLLGLAYAGDRQLGPAWIQFRQAVRLNPGYEQGARDFLAVWESFDRRGVLNVGQSPEQVEQALGRRDSESQAGDRLLWEYGFMRVNFVQNRLHSVIDPRGLEAAAVKPVDAVKMTFDGRQWQLGYRAVNRLQSLSEYVPEGQSVQAWNELFTLQRLFGMTERDVSPQKMMAQIQESLKKVNPDMLFEVLRESPRDVMFQWRVKQSKERSAQHEIVRLLAGQKDIHRLAYSKKVAQLPAQEAQQWTDILQQAQLIPLGARE